MMLEGPIDLATVDGRVARAQRSLERERLRLATTPLEHALKEARARDPFVGVRDVAGQSMFAALRVLDLGPAHAPHRDALLRWVHELLQARVGWELGIDEVDAMHAPDPSLPSSALAREHGRALAREHGRGGEPTTLLVSFDQARRALIEAPNMVVADVAFQRLGELAAPVAAVRKELRARRFEVARRLGLDHPWALASHADTGALEALARAVLDATEPLARALHADVQRSAEVTPEGAAAAFIVDAFGRDAREGWPAHLGTRWFEDVFHALAPRAPRALALPPALGGASFLRAASRWGAALRLGAVARSLPFALARDPYPVEAFVVGDALAVAVSDRVFAKRKLGLPARAADAHVRALTRVLFVTLRTTAALLIAGMRDGIREDEVEELTARVFGAPLPSDLAAAWSFGGFAGNTRVDLPARLVAAVRAFDVVRDLIERFDEDWFDNPRAGAHFASIGAGPVWQGDVPEPIAARALARSFEEALG